MQIATARLAGTDPVARGTEIGERFADPIRRAITAYHEFFAQRGIARATVRAIADSCHGALTDWAPGLAAEVEATARAVGEPLWRLAAVNARTEVLAAVAPDTEGECSTAVYAPHGSAPPQTVQTWDWHAYLCETGVIMTYAPDAAPRGPRAVGRVTMFTEPGVLGKIGVNDVGLGVHFNILHHASDRAGGGVPVHAIARRVLDEAATVDEAEAIIRSAPASASTVITVVALHDATNRAACFEISSERVTAVRPDAAGWLIHTNHFLAPAQRAGEATRDASTTFARFTHLTGVQSAMVDLSVPDRAAAMCGPAGALAPVCFRPDPAAPLHEQWTTLLTVSLNLAAGSLDYFPGAPHLLAEHGPRSTAPLAQ